MTWSKLLHDPADFVWTALNTRGARLICYVLIVAALFPATRFLLALVLLVTLGCIWTGDFVRTGSRKALYLAAVIGVTVVVYAFTYVDVTRVDGARLAMNPWGEGIKHVQEGTYHGEGEGFRGPIRVEVEVRNHRITAIRTLAFPDLISVKENDLQDFTRHIVQKGQLDRPEQPGMFRGAIETLTGYTNAVLAALTKGIPDYPQYSGLSRAFLNAFIGAAPTRVPLNALAILFAAFVVFDYALQSMLTPGTGRSINCYNCASCVGACPVKEAEGVQMPMGLVLLTRLGDYERVMELSKYCVGCGRCAAKCPIGNSGPLVISAAYQAWYAKKKGNALEEREGVV